MFSPKSKLAALAAGGFLIIGLPVYGLYSFSSRLNDRMAAVEHELQAVRAQNASRVQELSSDLTYMAQKMDVTEKDLSRERALAESLKSDNAKTDQRLRGEIARHSRVMNELRQQAETAQQDTSNKIGAVSGEVKNVRLDLDAAKTDLAANHKEIGDVRDSLSQQIAHNSSELADLRRRGERDYFEFDIRKSKDFERVADVKLQLKKADKKRQKYDVALMLDDNKIEKKDHVANELVTFLVGRDRLRYELVVNYVDKDRIRGYISTPKDKALSAEAPSFRARQ